MKVAGDDLERQAALQLGALVGAVITLDEVATQLDTKRIQMAARIRDTKLWEQAGFKSWDECCKKLFGERRTVNRKIAELEERGPDYFGISSIVRVGESVYSLMDVQDGAIQYNGEAIAITKANEGRIREIVGHYRAEAQKAKEQAGEKERALEKAKGERDNAKKAAQRASEELRDLKASASKPFGNATLAQSRLVLAQSKFVEAVALIEAARNEEDYTKADETWIAGLVEFAIKEVVETSGHDPLLSATVAKLDPTTPLQRTEAAKAGKGRHE